MGVDFTTMKNRHFDASSWAWRGLWLLWMALTLPSVAQGTAPPAACNLSPSGGVTNGVCRCSSSATGISVSCTEYSGIPANIPSGVTVLYLKGNLVELRKDQFSKYSQLKTLTLMNMNISSIHETAFRNLYRLENLILQNNRLTVLDPSGKTFQTLVSLKILDVSNNMITQINPYSFLSIVAPQKKALKVVMRNNPLNCDCNVYAFRQWLQTLNSFTLKLEDTVCENLGRRPYDGVPLSDLGQCGSTPLVVDDQATCRQCDSVTTNSECTQTIPVRKCQKGQVCKRTIFGNQISTGCEINMDTCAQLAYKNRISCLQLNTSVDCVYCCTDSICNPQTELAITNDYEYLLYFTARLSRTSVYNFSNGWSDILRERFLRRIPTMIDNNDFHGGLYFTLKNFEPLDYTYSMMWSVHVTVYHWRKENDVFSDLSSYFSFDDPPNYYAQVADPSTSMGISRIPNVICPENQGWPEAFPGWTLKKSCGMVNPQPNQYSLRTCIEPVVGKPEWGPITSDDCYTGSGQTPTTTQKVTTTTEESKVSISSKPLETTTTTPSSATLPSKLVSNYNTREAEQAVSQILDFISNKNSFTPEQMDTMVSILEKVATNPENLAYKDVSQKVLMCLSGIISTRADTLRESQQETATSERMLSLIDSVGENAPLQGGKFQYSSPNLGVASQGLSSREVRNVVFSEVESANDELGIKVGYSRSQPKPQDGYSNIVIPTESVIKKLNENQKQNFKRITFSVHNDSKLFDSIQSKKKPEYVRISDSGSIEENDDEDDDDDDDDDRLYLKNQVNGRIIAARVPGVKIEDLDQNITMNFQHTEKNSSHPQCVYWDSSMNGGVGGWTGEGCGVVRSDQESTTCGCNHLTNFALLMDIYQDGGFLSEADRKALSIISFIGCSISLLSLLLTLFTYSLFRDVNEYQISNSSLSRRKLRRDTPSKILINLCVALLFSNLVFLAGMQDYTFDSTVACKVVAVLLHYFMLASLCWMAVEAFYMYLALVLVFKTYFSNFILKISLFGWGIPAVVVAITLGVNATDNYGLLGTGLCWLKVPSFYIAFVGPVCFILLLNCIAFGLVIRQLMQMSSTKLNTSDRYGTLQRLRGAVGVIILLGLTWLFAIFAIDSASTPFYYLFAIFNSLQGLFIFIFYCLFKADAVASWKKFLSCCFDPSDLSSASASRAATFKASSAAANAGKRKISNSSVNNTVSTSSTLAKSATSNGSHIYDTLDNSVDEHNDANYLKLNMTPNAHTYANRMNRPTSQTSNDVTTNSSLSVGSRKIDHGLNHVYHNQPSKYQTDGKSMLDPTPQSPPPSSSPPKYTPKYTPPNNQHNPSQSHQAHQHSPPPLPPISPPGNTHTATHNNVSVVSVNKQNRGDDTDQSEDPKSASVSEIRLRFENSGSMHTHL